jgi:predicted GNAT superfamily acetyltransferase
MDETIVIRRLHTNAEFEAVNELELLVWGGNNPLCVDHLNTVSKNGGFVLGAFSGDLMVGMNFSCPCFLHGQVYLWSDMMGIRKEWRYQGIGEAMKRKQAEIAKEAGYPMIAWTYDPLETPNAYLNLSKLGAITSIYYQEYYGPMKDSLNIGLPSDRLQVEWWLDPIKKDVLTNEPGENLIDWDLNDQGFPKPRGMFNDLPKGEKLLLSVPADYRMLIREDFQLALKWREITRDVFQKCFAGGWAAVNLILNIGGPVHDYVLIKRSGLSLPQPPWQKGEYK